MLQIRSLEGQLRWSMQREETHAVVQQVREEDTDLMEWRDEQAALDRKLAGEKAATTLAAELEASKAFQNFKREVKAASKEEELQWIKQRYAEGLEQSNQQLDLHSHYMEQMHVILAERTADLREIRDIKLEEEAREKARAEFDRSEEERLTLSAQVSQLSSEKEELVKNLQFMRSMQASKPTRGSATLKTSLGRPAQVPAQVQVRRKH